jgi:hypothetical protein
MSLRKKVLLIALGAALAIVAGNLTAFKNAVSTVASAVWGS